MGYSLREANGLCGATQPSVIKALSFSRTSFRKNIPLTSSCPSSAPIFPHLFLSPLTSSGTSSLQHLQHLLRRALSGSQGCPSLLPPHVSLSVSLVSELPEERGTRPRAFLFLESPSTCCFHELGLTESWCLCLWLACSLTAPCIITDPSQRCYQVISGLSRPVLTSALVVLRPRSAPCPYAHGTVVPCL